MRTVACYNCMSGENEFYATENGFTLVRCAQCGLLYVNPRPEDTEIQDAHQTGSHRGTSNLNVTGRFCASRIPAYLRVLRELYRDGSSLLGKSWLDIGCGHGEFLVALRQFSKHSVVLKGVEPNIHKQETARKKGLDVTWLDLRRHSEKYDVISLLNVFSHLPDPPAAILAWKRILKPGGELLIETGDTADLCSEDHRRPFYLPDHLSFASEGIVVSILERCGFDVLQVRKYPYMKSGLLPMFVEMAKLFLPNRKSQLKDMVSGRAYVPRDMYVLARMRN
jgi:SAM-dependent methyltransferase